MDPMTMGMMLSAGMGAYGKAKEATAQRQIANMQTKEAHRTALVQLLKSMNDGFASRGMA